MSAVLEGVRLSELARCPRACALRAVGAPEGERDPVWEEYFARGALFEYRAYQQFRAKHGEENIERQREIPWALGTGHADLYVKPDRLLVEVKSTVTPTGTVFDDAITQLRMYLLHDPEATTAGLYVLNPSSLRRVDFVPVTLTAEACDDIHARIASVQRAIDTRGDDLPGCVCSNPGECRQRGCTYTDVAWEGWEPPPAVELTDQAKLVATELYAAAAVKREAKGRVEEADARYKQLCEQLAGMGVEPGRDYTAGPLKIRRASVAGRETLGLKALRMTGTMDAELEELLAPFIKVGDGHDRWYVTRVGEAPLLTPEDFGEDAPF